MMAFGSARRIAAPCAMAISCSRSSVLAKHFCDAVEGFSNRRLRRGVFHSLVTINRYLAEHNQKPQAFFRLDRIQPLCSSPAAASSTSTASTTRASWHSPTKIFASYCKSIRGGACPQPNPAVLIGRLLTFCVDQRKLVPSHHRRCRMTASWRARPSLWWRRFVWQNACPTPSMSTT